MCATMVAGCIPHRLATVSIAIVRIAVVSIAIVSIAMVGIVAHRLGDRVFDQTLDLGGSKGGEGR